MVTNQKIKVIANQFKNIYEESTKKRPLIVQKNHLEQSLVLEKQASHKKNANIDTKRSSVRKIF